MRGSMESASLLIEWLNGPRAATIAPMHRGSRRHRPRTTVLARLRDTVAGALLVLLAAPCAAQIEAVTEDGRRVLLHEDRTWEFAEPAEPQAQGSEPPLRLEVLSLADARGGCRIGLRLHNDASYPVVSLVLQFEALVGDGVPFDNAFVAFHGIKPTLSQYKALAFERLACGDITGIRMHGGDRCTMGELNKFSPASGECLRRVRVLDTPQVRMLR